MKYMKAKNSRLLMLLLGVTILTHPSARGEIGPGDIVGTAWTTVSWLEGTIVGQTTITPHYYVKTWYHRHKDTVIRPGFSVIGSIRQKMKQDRINMIFYETKRESVFNDVINESSTDYTAFPIEDLNVFNYDIRCYTYPDHTWHITTETQVHEEFVYAQVHHDGLLPDNGPWRVWLNTWGDQLYGAGTCAGPWGKEHRPWHVPVTVSENGAGQTVRIGDPNCILNCPFYLAEKWTE